MRKNEPGRGAAPEAACAAPAKLWNRSFVLLLQGFAFSTIGNVLYSIAIGIWVYQKTGSTALMGTMSSISYFASLFLQPLGGVLADRLEKRWLIVGTDAVRGTAMIWLGGLAFRGEMRVWQVLAVAGLAAVCNIAFSPAASAAVSLLVPQAELMRANSLMSGTRSLIGLAGNAVSGFLVAAFGVPLMILLNGVSFLISAFTEIFIAIPGTARAAAALTPRSLLGEFGAGFRYLKNSVGILPLLLAGAAVNLFCGGFGGIAYVWCLHKGMDVQQYGLFLGAESCAALGATLLLAAVPVPPRRRWGLMAAGCALQSVFYVAAMAASGFWPCAVLYGINAFFNGITNMMMYPAMIRLTDEAYRGRVIAISGALCDGGIALSMVLYGVLSQAFGVAPVALAGAVLTAVPYAVYAANPALRRVLEAKS